MTATGYVSTNGDARKVNKSGDTMTGELTLPDSSPDAPLNAASKGYVDTQDATRASAATQILAGTGLTGGGTLAADRTLTVAYGTTAGTAAQGNDGRITGAAQKSANLADLGSASAARSALGLGGAAVLPVGTTTGTVAAGDDPRFTNSRTPTAHASTHAAAGSDPVTPAAIGAVASSDSRLSDSRTPLAHAASHATGGSDPISPASIGAVASTALDTSLIYQPSFRLPRYPQALASLTEFQSGHGFTASGATFTANDTSAYVRGTQCAQIVTPGDGVTYNVTGTISTVDSTARLLRILVRVEDITLLRSLDVQLAVDNTFANGWTWNPQGTTGTSTYLTSGDWVLMSLGFADATALGAGARTGLTALRFRVRDTGTAALTVRLQAAELIADGGAVFPSGGVVLSADDCYQSFVDLGKSRLDLYGYPVTAYTIVDRIGLSGRMTLQELQDLQASSGWELACHAYSDTVHGLTYSGVTAAQVDSDARSMKAFAVANGWRGADLFALPKGATAKTTDGASLIPILQKYYNTVASTVNKTREVFPPSDPFRVRRISAISTASGGYAPTNITTSGGDLDKIKAAGGVLCLNFHQITTGVPADSSVITQTDFNAIIDGIASRGIPVLTMGELMRYALTSSSSGATVDNTSIPKKLGIVGAPGGSTLASAADHVHPRAHWSPEDHNLITWTQDPATCAAGQLIPTGGQVQFARIHLPEAKTITNILLFISAAGTSLTSGQCFAALYNSSKALVGATADQSTAWASTGTKTMALAGGAVACAAGDYFVAFYANSTGTLPTVLRGVSQSVVNAGLTASTSRYGTADGGLTTAMPSTLGTLSGASNAWWAALS